MAQKAQTAQIVFLSVAGSVSSYISQWLLHSIISVFIEKKVCPLIQIGFYSENTDLRNENCI